MNCSHCGKDLPENAQFCHICGRSIYAVSQKRQSTAPRSTGMPTSYIVLICLSVAAIIGAIAIPFCVLQYYGDQYSIGVFTGNNWPYRIEDTKTIENVCSFLIIGIIAMSITEIVYAAKQNAKYCLVSAIIIGALSIIGVNYLLNGVIIPSETKGAPTAFIITLILSVVMIVIATKTRRKKSKKFD